LLRFPIEIKKADNTYLFAARGLRNHW